MSYADEIQTMRGRQQRKQFVRAVARRLAASSTCPHRGRPLLASLLAALYEQMGRPDPVSLAESSIDVLMDAEVRGPACDALVAVCVALGVRTDQDSIRNYIFTEGAAA